VLSVGSPGAGHGQLRKDFLGLTLSSDETRLLVCDGGNRCVVVADVRDGRCLRELRGPVGTLRKPQLALVVPQTGQVLVADHHRSVVVVFVSLDDDTVVRTLGGDSRGTGPQQLNFPKGLAVLDGDVADAAAPDGPVAVVADTGDHRLTLFRVRDGTVVRHVGSQGSAPGQFKSPTAVTVVPAWLTGTDESWLVVTDSFNHRVQVLTHTGTVVRILQGNAVIKLGYGLKGVSVCVSTGEVLVTDSDHHRVVSWRLADGGGLHVLCGGGKGSGDGQLDGPTGVVVSRDGALWVADLGNQRLCLFR
jgi:DNA-binding beta-propeller fold protein YncE